MILGRHQHTTCPVRASICLSSQFGTSKSDGAVEVFALLGRPLSIISMICHTLFDTGGAEVEDEDAVFDEFDVLKADGFGDA